MTPDQSQRDETPSTAARPRICVADIMTSPAVTIPPQTSVRDVAKLLLQHGFSAVPVVDAAGTPIGIVSEGDLIGRREPSRVTGKGWWLALLADGGGEPITFSLPELDRPAGELMHAPVLTVAAEAPLRAVAELLQRHRIKRLPVMRGGKLVGIVSRSDLVRAIATHAPAPEPPPSIGWLGEMLADFFGADRLSTAGEDLRLAAAGGNAAAPANQAAAAATTEAAPPVTAQAFHTLVDEAMQAKLDAKSSAAQEADLARTRRAKQMLQQHLDMQIWETLIAHAREAASRGGVEFQLLRFPADMCTDHGRKIDVAEAGWPDTLQGEPAELYQRWERDLKPAGFGLFARILDYPHGRLGDVGLFLTWAKPTA